MNSIYNFDLEGKSDHLSSGIYENLDEHVNFATIVFTLRDDLEQSSVESGQYILRNSKNVYLRIGEEEKFILDLLKDGQSIKDMMVAYFFKYFKLGDVFIPSFVKCLYKSGFVLPQSHDIYKNLSLSLYRSKQKTLKQKTVNFIRTRIIKNILFFHNIDPIIERAYKSFGRFLCHRNSNIVFIFFILLSSVMFWKERDFSNFSFVKEGGSLVVGVLVLFLINIIVTSVHEFAHAISVKHFGRKVIKGGIVSHFGMPTFFVDTNDIWMRPKRERIIVSLAGPYSSLVLSAAFVFLITFIDMGSFESFFVKMVMWCWISALLNINPLLYFDGYYVLVDFFNYPMLRTRAIEELKKVFTLKKQAVTQKRAYPLMVYGFMAIVWTLITIGLTFVFLSLRFKGIILEFLQTNSTLITVLAIVVLLVTIIPVLITMSAFILSKLAEWKKVVESTDYWKNYYYRSYAYIIVTFGFTFLIAKMHFEKNTIPTIMIVTLFLFLTFQQVTNYRKNITGHMLLKMSFVFFCFVIVPFSFLIPYVQEMNVFKLYSFLPLLLIGCVLLYLLINLYLYDIGRRGGALKIMLLSLVLVNLIYFYNVELLLTRFLVLITFNCCLIYFTLNLYNDFLRSFQFVAPVDAEVPIDKGDIEKVKWTYNYIFQGIIKGILMDMGPLINRRFVSKMNKTSQGLITYYDKDDLVVKYEKGESLSELAPVLSKELENLTRCLRSFVGKEVGSRIITSGLDSLNWIEREVFEDFVISGNSETQSNEKRLTFLTNVKLFADFSEHEFANIFRNLRMEHFDKGVSVIREGQIGHEFYIVRDGNLEVLREKRRVAILSPGDIFGEKALITNEKRNATVRSLGKVKLLVMDEVSFKGLMEKSSSFNSKIRNYMDREFKFTNEIQSIGPFKNVDPKDVLTLCDTIKFRHFKSGELIIREGDDASSFYIIKTGKLEAYVNTSEGKEKVISTLGKGEFFGEIAMLKQLKRTANVRVVEETVLYEIVRNNFCEVLSDSWCMERISTRRLKEKDIHMQGEN